jgi:DNA-binding PadR family transcriptional regulator
MDAPLEAKTLLLLELALPAFGQQLMRRASTRGGRLRPASVYPALRKLEARGLVRSWSEKARTGPPRRVYELTVEGVELATRRRDELIRLVGLATTSPAAPPRRRALMEERLRRCARASAAARSLRDAMRETSGR